MKSPELLETFGNDLYEAAARLVEIGCVLEVRVLQAGSVIAGTVGSDAHAGQRPDRHRVYIRRGESECSCGQRSPCVHIAAVSIAAERSARQPSTYARQAGATALRTVPAEAPTGVAPPHAARGASTASGLGLQRLFYCVQPSQQLDASPALAASGRGRCDGLLVSLWVGQVTPGNGQLLPESACAFVPRNLRDFPRYVDSQDREILGALMRAQSDGPWSLHGEAGARALRDMVATGRAFWSSLGGRALRPGQPRRLSFAWEVLADGNQLLACAAPPSVKVLPGLEPVCYIDAATLEFGSVDLPWPGALLRRYWSLHPVAPERVAAVNQQIAPAAFPTLQALPVQQTPVHSIAPRLVLTSGPDAVLHYVYNGLAVDSRRLRDDQALVRQASGPAIHEMPRDRETEQRFETQLHQVLPEIPQDRDGWLAFMVNGVPTLTAGGWDVSVEPGFPYRMALPEQWYGDVATARKQEWFSLRLGVVVNGQQINLLPVLARYLQTEWTETGTRELLASDALGQQMSPADTPDGAAAAAGRLPSGQSPAPAQLSAPDTPDRVPDEAGCRVGEHWVVRLEDGRYLPIPIDRLQRIANTLVELFDRSGLDAREWAQEGLALPRTHTGRLALLSRELNGATLQSDDPTLRSWLEDLASFDGIRPLTAPVSLRAVLRPYQEDGLGWLQFLRQHRLGGILADDMGLGKTVQTLAHLVLEKEQGRLDKPSLIVAPVSTLGNWQQEIRRFAPELSLLVWHGARRRELKQEIGRADIVLTGYPLLQIDAELLLERDFHLLILDEAQTIKNPRAKVSHVARALQARHRLCLTGTPVENHLGELWSLFEFLQPGLLGDERQFQRLYRTPIEKNNDRRRSQALAARLAPFMLRRTKDAVARELPPKTEIMESIVLEERQRDFYDGIRLAMHRRIQEVIRSQGLGRSQITILDALLKMRQACCDPRLLGIETGPEPIGSAKLDWLSTVLPELVEEGRRILLFSQFTSMLRLIEETVTALGIPYCLLTGETRNRPEVIERFQSGAAPLFLISLKAGGTGLNLTAADTVIHYDPWWNPAVEAQATDRAHRIGQDKPVFVYKLIAQGTVEERITQLQADKHALASRLFSEKNASPAQLSASDLELLFAP